MAPWETGQLQQDEKAGTAKSAARGASRTASLLVLGKGAGGNGKPVRRVPASSQLKGHRPHEGVPGPGLNQGGDPGRSSPST